MILRNIKHIYILNFDIINTPSKSSVKKWLDNSTFYWFLVVMNKKSNNKSFFKANFYSQIDVIFSLKSEFQRSFELSVAVKKLLQYQFLNTIQSLSCDSFFNSLNYV